MLAWYMLQTALILAVLLQTEQHATTRFSKGIQRTEEARSEGRRLRGTKRCGIVLQLETPAGCTQVQAAPVTIALASAVHDPRSVATIWRSPG